MEQSKVDICASLPLVLTKGADPGDDDPPRLHGLQGLPLHRLRLPEPPVQVGFAVTNTRSLTRFLTIFSFINQLSDHIRTRGNVRTRSVTLTKKTEKS
jgi:hypothetical protein